MDVGPGGRAATGSGAGRGHPVPDVLDDARAAGRILRVIGAPDAVEDFVEPVEFDAPLELLAWGRNTYTVLYLDELLEDAVAAAGTRRVEGSIDGVPVNLGVNRADVALRPFCYVGGALQRRLDARAGDVVTCRLQPADPDHVPLPDDVRAALEEVDRLDAFQRRRPARRRQDLQPIEDAARETTRRARIAALVWGLAPS